MSGDQSDLTKMKQEINKEGVGSQSTLSRKRNIIETSTGSSHVQEDGLLPNQAAVLRAGHAIGSQLQAALDVSHGSQEQEVIHPELTQFAVEQELQNSFSLKAFVQGTNSRMKKVFKSAIPFS